MGARGVTPTHPGLRAMEKVTVDEDGCWLFSGYCNPKSGYGQVSSSVDFHPSRTVATHVAVWMFFEGPVPDGLVLDHLCRVPACCNPGHLEPVTNRENCMRGEAPRIVLSRENLCQEGHELTEANTYTNPGSGHRRCRFCRDAKRHEYYERTAS